MKISTVILVAALTFVSSPTVRGALPTPGPECRNAEFQFSAVFNNRGVDGKPAHAFTAYLWIPPSAAKLRGLIVTQQNVGEQPFTESAIIREACVKNDLAIVWCCPAIDIRFEKNRPEAVRLLEEVLTTLGKVSGYSEIATAPWFTFGHSTTATFARTLAEARPARTIAIISAKGGIMLPVTGSYPGIYSGGHYPEWRQQNADWTTYGKSLPGLEKIRQELRNRWRPVSFVEEYGGGHFDYTPRYLDFLALYIDKAMKYRVNANGTLRAIGENEGWVVDMTTPLPTAPMKIMPLAEATGELRNAPWFFDRELAEAAAAVMDNGKWDRENQIVAFANLDGTPAAFSKSGIADPVPYELADDGVTIKRIGTTFLDELPANFKQAGMKLTHATTGQSTIERISGIFAAHEGRYEIELNRGYPDTPNFIAVRHPGDAKHRPSIQPGRFVPPVFKGRPQQITFQKIADRPLGAGPIELRATSSAGLKVRYFVRSGPATIIEDKLVLLRLPPRTNFPVKVTVVAWQIGRDGTDPVASAELTEQTFELTAENTPLPETTK